MADIAPSCAHAARGARCDPSGKQRFIGIDTGLRRTGYAILSEQSVGPGLNLHEAGVIRLDSDQSIENRLVELERSLRQIIDQHRPTVLACEELYAHYKHPRTAILMGHARGVVLLTAAQLRLRVISVSATRVKKTLTGNGHAGKQQMQTAISMTLGLCHAPEPDDVADAIAIALAGIRLDQLPLRGVRGRRG
ncbi:MAG: crossover junction endodeoxyribonuclease RuvC [Phycisphaerales bacterium]|nr:crossover junction endodeoxyribonuclease RuvC [Phycisphaerales bacterium]